MNVQLKKHALAVAVLVLAWAPSGAQAAGWDWVVAPYVWFAGIKTDLSTAEPPVLELASDTSFDDVIDKLDGAFQIHAEGQGDKFGVFSDFTFLGLADEKEHDRYRSESDLDVRLFEVAGVWSPGEGRFEGLDLFAGLRHIDIDFTLQIDPVNPAFANGVVDSGEKFNDFMIGARYSWDISERWGMMVRGDGSFGDTEGTWNASATAQYRTNSGAWVFGYRYLSVEVQPNGNELNLTMSGPMLGYAFKF